MNQQNINFLDSLHGNKRDQYQFSIRKFILVNILFNVFMLLLAFFSLFHLFELTKDTSLLSAEATNKEKTLAILKSHFPKTFFDKQKGADTDKTDSDLMYGEKVMESLGSNLFFSNILVGLSNDIVPQVWLTKMNVINQSGDILLYGKSYSEKQLEKFIYNISKDKVFASYAFNMNRLERISEKNEVVIIEFEIKLSGKVS